MDTGGDQESGNFEGDVRSTAPANNEKLHNCKPKVQKGKSRRLLSLWENTENTAVTSSKSLTAARAANSGENDSGETCSSNKETIEPERSEFSSFTCDTNVYQEGEGNFNRTISQKEADLRMFFATQLRAEGRPSENRVDFVKSMNSAACKIQRIWRTYRKQAYWKKVEDMLAGDGDGPLFKRNDWGGFTIAKDPFSKPEGGEAEVGELSDTDLFSEESEAESSDGSDSGASEAESRWPKDEEGTASHVVRKKKKGRRKHKESAPALKIETTPTAGARPTPGSSPLPAAKPPKEARTVTPVAMEGVQRVKWREDSRGSLDLPRRALEGPQLPASPPRPEHLARQPSRNSIDVNGRHAAKQEQLHSPTLAARPPGGLPRRRSWGPTTPGPRRASPCRPRSAPRAGGPRSPAQPARQPTSQGRPQRPAPLSSPAPGAFGGWRGRRRGKCWR
uniref:Uncharacterized protein n=1 Tax=Tetraselmis sp. GSL018 TaxID=582737 RepID=A0A061RV47_9CHLO